MQNASEGVFMESDNSAGNSFVSAISWALSMSAFFHLLSFLFCFCLLGSCLYDSSSPVWLLSSRFCLTVFVEQCLFVNKRRGICYVSPPYSSLEISLSQSVLVSALSIVGDTTILPHHYLHLKNLHLWLRNQSFH